MPFWRRLLKGIDLTWAELDSNFDYLDRPSPVVATLNASGILAITGPGLYRVETFGGAGTQNFIGITGGEGHEWPVILTLNTPGRIVTLVNTPPNFLLQNGASFLLNSVNDSIELRDRTTAIWREIGRCSV